MICSQLGMTDMFGPTANFNSLLDSPEPLHVSDVVHKAFIEINEDGAEAAAATGKYSKYLRQISNTDFCCCRCCCYVVHVKSVLCLFYSFCLRSIFLHTPPTLIFFSSLAHPKKNIIFFSPYACKQIIASNILRFRTSTCNLSQYCVVA